MKRTKGMRNWLVGAMSAGVVFTVGIFFGQARAAGPEFEVASIKPAAQPTPELFRSGKIHIGMTVDGARVDIGGMPLTTLIQQAYRVKLFQVVAADWMRESRWDILAKLPDGGSKEQIPEMLQALLADRFKLAIHRDKKELPVYALIVGKNGPKLTEASAEPDAPLPDAPGRGFSVGTEKGQMKMVQDGKGGGAMQVAGQAGTTRFSVVDGKIHLELTKVTVAALVDTLTPLVDRPVLDMTDLKGTYQIALDLPIDDLQILAQRQAAALGIQMPGAPAGANANPADAASTPGGSAIFAAMEKLGLKLDARKAPVETIVVDHLEKTPTEN